jgi:ankyrin repeat protein
MEHLLPDILGEISHYCCYKSFKLLVNTCKTLLYKERLFKDWKKEKVSQTTDLWNLFHQGIYFRDKDILELIILDKKFPIVCKQSVSPNEPFRLLLKAELFELCKLIFPITQNNLVCLRGTTLMWACESGNQEMVDLVIENMLKINIQPIDMFFHAALLKACEAGFIKIAETLLKIRPSCILYTKPYRSPLPLEISAKKGFIDIVNLLLKFDCVHINANNNKVIKKAAKYGHIEIVKLLLIDKRLKLDKSLILDILNIANVNNHPDIVNLMQNLIIFDCRQ